MKSASAALAALLLLTQSFAISGAEPRSVQPAQYAGDPNPPLGPAPPPNPAFPIPDASRFPADGLQSQSLPPGGGQFGPPNGPPPPNGFGPPNRFGPPGPFGPGPNGLGPNGPGPNGLAPNRPGPNGFGPNGYGPNGPGPFSPVPPPNRPKLLMRDYSWIYIDVPPARQVKVHDIITVLVDEKSEVTEQSTYNRQKNGIFKADLKEFIRIDDRGNLNNAAQNDPKIDSQLQATLNTRGNLQQREGVKYRIAATVVDVLPNGTIILEARKSIRTNFNLWEYSLTGRIRAQDVLANNTVLSENIADMIIVKKETGRVRDSTKRGWLIVLYDWFGPF